MAKNDIILLSVGFDRKPLRMKFAEKTDDSVVRVWAPRLSDCVGAGGAMTIQLPDMIGEPLPAVVVPNGDFSQFEGENGFVGWQADAPGTKTFRDEDVKFSGKASLRMEFSKGCGRILALKFIDLPANCSLRLVMRLKSKGLFPSRKFTSLTYHGDTRFSGPVYGRLRRQIAGADMDWTESAYTLDVKDKTSAMIAIGSWAIETGMVWLDEVRIERGAGGTPKVLPVGYDARFVEPRAISNPDFYLWYLDRLSDVVKNFPEAKVWRLATAKPDGSPLSEDMRWKAKMLAENFLSGRAVKVELEDA